VERASNFSGVVAYLLAGQHGARRPSNLWQRLSMPDTAPLTAVVTEADALKFNRKIHGNNPKPFKVDDEWYAPSRYIEAARKVLGVIDPIYEARCGPQRLADAFRTSGSYRDTMGNRHQRRSDLRAFKREAHREHLLTYLIDADDDAALNRVPLLSRAVSFWHGNIQQRRPFCPICKRNYTEDALPGAFLFATIAVAPRNASVTVFCNRCWRDLPLDMIERSAERVLQKLVPGGHFEPLAAP
jgi:hypothetical protein